MNSTGRSNISSIFQHGLQDGYLSLNPHVKGGLFPLTRVLKSRDAEPWHFWLAPAPAPAPAPGKMYRLRRLRLRWSSPHIFKNVKCQNMTSYWLVRKFECYFEWVSLKFVTRYHPRPLADIREVTDSFGLRCQISSFGPKWSFATDTQRILNIRRRISPRWHFWSVAWPNLIKDFLGVQIIKNACFWHWRKFQVGNSLHLF